jgi:CubicO group peptidase (beta-lactamase class C family)
LFARMFSWVLGVVLTFPVQAQSPPRGAPASIDTLFQQLHERGQFNGAVLVAQRGQVVYRGAFGFSDQDAHVAFTPETPSCIASLSKSFTALAIMMLVEQHRLSYDESIQKYFPALPEKLGAATVRQLLNHTSGIPDYSSDLNVDHPGITTGEVLNALAAVREPVFPPGEKYQYNNSGYLLAGLIVEKITGKSLPDFLQERVFKPLGMKSTFALTAGRTKTREVARGIDDFGDVNDASGYLGGDGGLYSTVDDLFAYDQALYTERLVRKQTLEQAFTPGRVRTGEMTYGFGWNIADDAGGKRVWHTGNTAGFRGFFERRLPTRTTVIMLTNRGNSRRTEINAAIQNILAGKPYDLPKRSIAVKMRETDLKSGIDAALAEYQAAKAAGSAEYDLGESELNMLGYRLLYEDHEPQHAVKIFTLNTVEHPSSNAYDSLAESYQVVGDTESARKNYQIAIEKDPTNLHARGMLEKIRE